MRITHFALGFAALALAGTASAANRPAGYKTICTEGKTCTVAAATSVAYGRADKGYLSRARPFKRSVPGDYDHLARVWEWAVAGGDEEASE